MGQKRDREPDSPDSDLQLLHPEPDQNSRSDQSELTSIPIQLDVLNEKKRVNRCSGCRRKVGLIGFRCRCGDLFCWEHRYSDRHDCRFDYKASGRAAIARENPVIRPAKILKV